MGGDGLTENQIQRAVFDHLRKRGAPCIFFFHPKNGGRHQARRGAAINTGLGVVAGVPDVIVIHKGNVYAMELKRVGGRATEKQFDAIFAIRNAGGHACIAEGLDRAITCLEGWGLLRGGSARAPAADEVSVRSSEHPSAVNDAGADACGATPGGPTTSQARSERRGGGRQSAESAL